MQCLHQAFTIAVGAIFEDSKISLDKWLLIFCLMASSKKDIGAHLSPFALHHLQAGVVHGASYLRAHALLDHFRLILIGI